MLVEVNQLLNGRRRLEVVVLFYLFIEHNDWCWHNWPAFINHLLLVIQISLLVIWMNNGFLWCITFLLKRLFTLNRYYSPSLLSENLLELLLVEVCVVIWFFFLLDNVWETGLVESHNFSHHLINHWLWWILGFIIGFSAELSLHLIILNYIILSMIINY